MSDICEWCGEPLRDCSPDCDRELRERLAAAQAERDAALAREAGLRKALLERCWRRAECICDGETIQDRGDERPCECAALAALAATLPEAPKELRK